MKKYALLLIVGLSAFSFARMDLDPHDHVDPSGIVTYAGILQS